MAWVCRQPRQAPSFSFPSLLQVPQVRERELHRPQFSSIEILYIISEDTRRKNEQNRHQQPHAFRQGKPPHQQPHHHPSTQPKPSTVTNTSPLHRLSGTHSTFRAHTRTPHTSPLPRIECTIGGTTSDQRCLRQRTTQCSTAHTSQHTYCVYTSTHTPLASYTQK